MRAPVAAVNVDTLAQNWSAVLVRGVMGVVFGLITFFAPGLSLAVLVLLWGAYALVDGALAIASAIRRHGTTEHWWLLLLEGIAGVVVGIMTFAWPGITALVLLYMVAAWALVTGVFEIAAAIRLRKAITGEWLLALGGIESIGFGILLFLYPGAGALALIVWIGAYAFFFGVLLIALAFRLRSWASTHGAHPAPAPA